MSNDYMSYGGVAIGYLSTDKSYDLKVDSAGEESDS